ncbi:MAG: hypothetical protein WBG92_07565 [Thiohalocapsa sp.]
MLSAAIGACSAGAETFQYGGSTTIIEQSGGNSTSRSKVTRFHDGQRIITQDGSSTDITVQRSGDYPTSNEGWEHPGSSADRFDRSSIEERFSRSDSDGRSANDCSGCTASSTREAFKQRMQERMRSDSLP